MAGRHVAAASKVRLGAGSTPDLSALGRFQMRDGDVQHQIDPFEDTVDFGSPLHVRPLHEWMESQMPTQTLRLWPDTDPDTS